MNRTSASVAGESLAEAGERIRDAVPIRGDRATEENCRNRRELIDDTLTDRGIRPGTRQWHTAQLGDGHVAGIWATSVEEAELELTVWWGGRCHWVRPDPGCWLLHEYFPNGKRSASEADRRFPLAPPRRVRDRFAPATSLLDDIWPSPTASPHRLGRR